MPVSLAFAGLLTLAPPGGEDASTADESPPSDASPAEEELEPEQATEEATTPEPEEPPVAEIPGPAPGTRQRRGDGGPDHKDAGHRRDGQRNAKHGHRRGHGHGHRHGHAKKLDMTGKFGIGPIRTLAGINGINARVFVLDRFSLGVNFGAGTFSYQAPSDPSNPESAYTVKTVGTVGGSLEALYWAHKGKPAGGLPLRADFGLGGRVGVAHLLNAVEIEGVQDDPLEIHVEIPLLISVMLGNNLALIPEFGAAFRVIPGKREPDAEGSADSNPGLEPGLSQLSNVGRGPGFSFQLGQDGLFGLFVGGGLAYYF